MHFCLWVCLCAMVQFFSTKCSCTAGRHSEGKNTKAIMEGLFLPGVSDGLYFYHCEAARG